MTTFEVTDPALRVLTGEAKFYSITYRCFKLPNLESQCEDYGALIALWVLTACFQDKLHITRVQLQTVHQSMC